MKKLSALLLIFTFLSSLIFGQSGFEIESDQELPLNRTSNSTKEKVQGNQSLAKQISTDFIALSGYGEGGTTVDIPFRFHLPNLDGEYGDSLSMTFPEGFTILGVSNDDIFAPSYDPGGEPEAFNGIDGQTISWGDNDNNFGGLTSRLYYQETGRPSGPYSHFTVTLSIDESVSGPQTIEYHVSGDGVIDDPESDEAGDFDGTITIDEGLSVAGTICSSPDHNTLEFAIYEVGVMYGLGPINPSLTIFAPTDEAFDALPEGLLEELLESPACELRNVILYHGTAPEVSTDDMFDGQVISTGIPDDVTISIEDDNFFVNDVQITIEDVEATNGIVHVIDAVLIPPTPVSPIMMPLEFEFHEFCYGFFGFEGANSRIISNPDQSGINTSDQVMRTIKTEGAPFIAGTVIFLDEPIDFSNSSSVHLSSWSPKDDIPVRLKLESDDNGNIELDVNTTVTDEWEILTYDFSGLVNPDAEYVRVVVFYEFINGLEGDGSTYYFDNITVGDPLTNGEPIDLSEFRVFPNPANYEFALELNLKASTELTIDLVNILGQQVKSYDLGTRSTGLNREVLDVNDLPEGIYIINITAGNEQATTKLQIAR